MQLVVALLIYTIFSIPALLVWPGRGLSFRNLGIALGSAMLGLAIGFVLLLALDGKIDNNALMLMMGAVAPATLAFVGVRILGNKGFSVSRERSLLYQTPYRVALWAAASIACGTLVFAVLSWKWSGGVGSGGWLFFLGLGVPLSVLQLVAIAGSIESSTWRVGLRDAVWTGGVVLLGSFVLLGPYFIFALPVGLYAAVVPLVFSMLIQRFVKS
jgi:hypothetical protein